MRDETESSGRKDDDDDGDAGDESVEGVEACITLSLPEMVTSYFLQVERERERDNGKTTYRMNTIFESSRKKECLIGTMKR